MLSIFFNLLCNWFVKSSSALNFKSCSLIVYFFVLMQSTVQLEKKVFKVFYCCEMNRHALAHISSTPFMLLCERGKSAFASELSQ